MARLPAWVSMALGGLALAVSLSWALLARGDAARDLEGEVETLRSTIVRERESQSALEKDLAALEGKIESARSDALAVEAEVDRVLVSDPRLAAGAATAIAELSRRVAELEEGSATAVAAETGEEADAESAEIEPPETEAAETEPVEPGPVEHPGTAVAESKAGKAASGMNERLEILQTSIVLVASSRGQLATGLVVGVAADKVHVLTVATAVSPGCDVACLFRSADRTREGFQSLPFEVVYREKDSPCIILEGKPPTGATQIAILDAARFSSSQPKKGAPVFAVGAHAVGATAFTGSVFEGIVSSEADDSEGGRGVLRTTLPMNDGSAGSVVVGDDGKVIGIQWKNLDRSAAVLPAAAARSALERIGIAWAGGETPAAGSVKAVSISETSVDLPEAPSVDAEVFAGPDDLVIVWERALGTLAAYRSGSPSPVWTLGKGTWSLLSYRPWQPNGFLSSTSPPVSVVVNLRTGKLGSRLPPAQSGFVSRTWATFPFGKTHVVAFPQGFAMLNLETGRGYNLSRAGAAFTLMAHAKDLLTLTTDKGDLGWLSRDKFLTIFTRIDALQLDIEKQLRKDQPNQEKIGELNRQITVLAGQLQHGIEIYKVPGGVGRDPARPGTSFCHVPGTYLHIIGRTLWQIGPDKAILLGRFEALRHRSSLPAWNAAYQPCAQASPDGRLAVTGTHVYAIDGLEVLAELPLPSGPAGFTSKTKLIYGYDRDNRRLVFWSIDELLGSSGVTETPGKG